MPVRRGFLPIAIGVGLGVILMIVIWLVLRPPS